MPSNLILWLLELTFPSSSCDCLFESSARSIVWTARGWRPFSLRFSLTFSAPRNVSSLTIKSWKYWSYIYFKQSKKNQTYCGGHDAAAFDPGGSVRSIATLAMELCSFSGLNPCSVRQSAGSDSQLAMSQKLSRKNGMRSLMHLAYKLLFIHILLYLEYNVKQNKKLYNKLEISGHL